MSDVYKIKDYSCYNSTTDNAGAPLSTSQVFIIVTVSTSLVSMIALLLLTFCSAMKIAKQLSSTMNDIDGNVNPDVIVVEEPKDLQSQTSAQQLTLNRKDTLEDFYEKVPSTENHPATPM